MKALLLLLLPLIFLSTIFETKNQRGPFWMEGNMDPEYAYLLNSLNMSEFKVVGHVDHPGTTTQLFGAVVLTASKMIEGKSVEQFEESVLTNPEKYMGIIITMMLYLYALVMLVCGRHILKATNSLFTALSFQFIPFLFPSLMWGFSFRLSAEPILMIFGQIFCCFSLIYSVRKNINEEKFTMQSAFIVAAGVVTKIIFIPYLLIPLFLIKKIKNKIKYFGWFLLGFFILVIPILSKFNNFTRFVREIFLHKGFYGYGEPGFISYVGAIGFLQRIYHTHILFLIIPFISLFIINKLNPNTKKLMWGLLASYVLLFLSVVKHPDMHYLISGVPLLGTILILIMESPLKRQRLVKSLFIVFAFLNLQTLRANYKADNQLTNKIQAEWVSYEKLKATNYSQCATLSFGFYSKYKGLMFGNHFATHRYEEKLAQLYPEAYFVESENKIVDWKEDSQNYGQFFKHKKCVVAFGSKKMFEKLNFKNAKEVQSGEFNNFYVIK